MGAEVPYAVHRYIFGHLLGQEPIGRHRDYVLDQFSEFKVRAGEGGTELLIPEKGLYQQYREVQRDLTNCTETLSEIYSGCPRCGVGAHCLPEDRGYIEYLQSQQTEFAAEVDRLKRQIEVLQRLADPELMGGVYEQFIRSRLDGQQMTSFIEAARATDGGYAEYREIRKEAAKLIPAVADAATKLARLIQELRQTGVRLPPEVRLHSYPNVGWSLSSGVARSRLQMLRLIEDLCEFGDKRSEAPRPVDLRPILLAAAQSLRDWPVDFGSPEIEAATSSRQNSKKSAQIRAFGASLQAAGVKLDTGMYRAIAVAMCVVANDTEAEFSEDDVRKALKRVVKARPRKPVKAARPSVRKTHPLDTP